VFHESFTAFLVFFFDSVIPRINSPAGVTLIKWSSAALLILPQSILLGMTFPLMSGGIIRRYPERPGETLSMLYFSNSIGGALGVLTSGFFLIGAVGLPGTIRTAGVINIGLALLVLYFGKAPERPFATSAVEQPIEQRRGYWILLLVALLTGTASFIYEIAWIRMLSMVLGSSTHSFELMLSAFILGLALGGLWIRRRIDSITEPTRLLAIVQVVMGLLALSTLIVYGGTFNVMQWLLKVIPKSEMGYLLFNISSHGLAMAVMLPTTFCAGMTLPVITYVLLRRGLGEKSIGAVYSANTVGAIVGVIFAVHIGMPGLGLKNLMVVGAAVDIALGLLLLGIFCRDEAGLKTAAASAGLIAIVAILAWVHLDPYRMASGVFRRTQTRLDFAAGDLVISHVDGKTATIDTVWQSTRLSIRTNGKVDATVNKAPGGEATLDEGTMVLSGALPLLLHPTAKTAANIGMGSGLTSQLLLTTGLLSHVDTIEIEAEMVKAARHFRPRNELVFSDPRSQVHIEDAKTFFATHRKRYDIIVSEPSNPWVSGVAGLFSLEFYELVSRHLNEGGLFVQWLQLYEIDAPLVGSVLKAVSRHFTDYHVYAINQADILIVARRDKAVSPPDPNVLQGNPEFAAELRKVNINGLHDIKIRKIGDKRLLQPWLRSLRIPANSDYYPIIDLQAERARFLELNSVGLLFLREAPLPILEMLDASYISATGAAITPDRRLDFTQRFFAATQFRNQILGHETTQDFSPAASGTEKEVRKFLDQCRLGSRQIDKPTALFKFGLEVVPYLQPNELADLWETFRKLPCASPTREEEKSWLDLFQAIGTRNARAMGDISETLLKQGVDAEYRAYLTGVATLANRVQGNYSRVGLLWKEHPARHPGWAQVMDILSAEEGPESTN
jgi:predicted membrane-bound spermidine synthase